MFDDDVNYIILIYHYNGLMTSKGRDHEGLFMGDTINSAAFYVKMVKIW